MFRPTLSNWDILVFGVLFESSIDYVGKGQRGKRVGPKTYITKGPINGCSL